MAVMLTPAEMAEVTGGVWENLVPDLEIDGVEYIFHYVKKGDLFVVHHSICHKIEAALERGAAALIVRSDCVVHAAIPVLRVENTYSALRHIALASSDKSNAKRLLVTGSYGKTGFKNHLYAVIRDQFSTYARPSSANHVESTYCNLASLQPGHELLVIEQPVSTKEKTARRARYVKPDICVITSIGHEHIERFGSVETIVRNKTQIAKALKPGGVFLIPGDDPYCYLLKKRLETYGHFELILYGSRSDFPAHIVSKTYRDFGWDVTADIEGEIVSYRVPFPELHEPVSSLAVLLAVKRLGGDVTASAEQFSRCSNFKSSGKLYTAQYRGKRFYLYDQSHRGGIEGYASFFRALKYMHPTEGRTLLVTSEFVDYKDGEMALIDEALFRSLIADARIDALFSVEKFPEHMNVLADKSIWKKHSLDFRNVVDDVLAAVEEGDLLCIKGIFESELPKMVKMLEKDRAVVLMPVDEAYMSRETTSSSDDAMRSAARIVTLGREHLYALKMIQREVFAPEEGRIGTDYFLKYLDSGTIVGVVDHYDERIVKGFCKTVVSGDWMRIHTVAVAPAHQGKGVGRSLLTYVMDAAEENGIRRFYLEVAPEKETAIGLYRSLGFETVKRLHGFFPDGRDALRMERTAAQPGSIQKMEGSDAAE